MGRDGPFDCAGYDEEKIEKIEEELYSPTPEAKLREVKRYLTEYRLVRGFYVRSNLPWSEDDYYACMMCNGYGDTTQEINHKTDCPVVALLKIIDGP